MKLLLCLPIISQYSTLVAAIEATGEQLTPVQYPAATPSFLSQACYLQHELTICETGYGQHQSYFKINKALQYQKYHLALKLALCKSYKEEIRVGDVVNVIKDKPADHITALGDLYQSQLLDANSYPHHRGGYINMNNSYLNVLMPYRKVVSLTLAAASDAENFERYPHQYAADIETNDGLGFVYACMYERQPFYQLCGVAHNLMSQEKNEQHAQERLASVLLDLIQKL